MLTLIIISPSTAVSFLLTSLLIELTPGPNMTYLTVVAAGDGRRAGFATVAGVALGLGVVGIVAALGVAQVIQESVLIYGLLRWTGVLFLLYLAWEGWQSGVDVVADQIGSDRRYFARGFITNLLNPKAGIFYIAVLPTFIDLKLPLTPQAMALTAIYVGVATVVHVAIVLVASTLKPILNDPRREQGARRFLSGMLAIVAVWFAWSTGQYPTQTR